MLTNAKSVTFPNLGYLETEVPEDIKEFILQYSAEEMRGNDVRDGLIGHNEFACDLPELTNCFEFKQWLTKHAMDYDEVFPLHREKVDSIACRMELALTETWMNISRKHDFNPMHHHHGVFSFVIWLEIPFNREDELANRSQNNIPQASEFTFKYIDMLGQIGVKSVEQKPWKMLFFPAKLNHEVNPFYTSDDQRVSISGNMALVPPQQ